MAEIERPSKGTNGFQSLIADIIRILGPSSGINSADVDPSELQSLMKRYSSSEADWGMFALNDNSRSYVRNLIDKGNGKANILLLVWNPGRGSMIHDHSNSHCIMKVLKGSLKETLYNWPDPSLVRDGVSSPLVVQKEAVFQENEVTYISDQIGLHRISNPHPNEVAVSLHLYTPPYGSCRAFDERTGKASSVTSCVYFSYLGTKL